MTDDKIKGEGRTLRTIQGGNPQVVFDELLQEYTLTSAAFSPSRDGFMSVDLEQVLRSHAKPITANYPSLPRAVALVSHSVASVKAEGMTVHHQPLNENYYHGGIGNIKNKDRRWMKDHSEIVVPLDQNAARLHDQKISGSSA